MGSHFFLQGIFLTLGWNLGFLHWQMDSLPLSYLESQAEVPPALFASGLNIVVSGRTIVSIFLSWQLLGMPCAFR